MTVRFSPYRSGAAHVLERDDVLLLRGSPAYHDVGEFDTRICIRANGLASRALWFNHSDPWEQPGPKSEFHLWEYRITQSQIESVVELLRIVYRAFAGLDIEIEGNDTGDFLTFWHGDERFTASIHTGPPEAVDQYSADQVEAFVTACNRIYQLAPQQSEVARDSMRHTT